MSEVEKPDTHGRQDPPVQPIPYVRAENVKSFWRAVAGGGVLAILVTLFVALSVSNRDYVKSVGDNLRGVVETWNRNFEKLSDRVYELEKWAWKRGKR